jgi:polyribonucleotide nucleotidyltransferase
MEFGAFVNFFGPKDGLVHISELASRRVQNVKDVVKEGDKVKVKFLGQDERGKIRLSMRVVDQETGADITEQVKAQRDAERAERGDQGGDREERGDRPPRRDRDDRGPRRDRGDRDRGPREERSEGAERRERTEPVDAGE